MHIFKNKTKDVKQFLQEAKANRSNRSSNMSSLEKNKLPNGLHPTHLQESNARSNSNNKINFEPSRNRPTAITYNSQFNLAADRPTFVNQVNQLQRNAYPPNSHYSQIPTYPQMSQQITAIRQSSQQPHFYNNQSQNQEYYEQPLNERRFKEPTSSAIYHDQSFTPITTNKFRSPRNYEEIPQSRPNSSQNCHFQNDLQDERGIYNPRSFSQISNVTTYEPSQYYQNSSFAYPNFQNNVPKRIDSMTFSNKRIMPKIQRSISQNEIPNLQHPNTQAVFNKYENLKLMASQISNISFPMEQIQQVQPGLSTEKDSPAKLTQMSSKPKERAMDKNTPMRNLSVSSVFQVTQTKMQHSRSQKILLKKSVSKVLQSKQQKILIQQKKQQLFQIKQSQRGIEEKNITKPHQIKHGPSHIDVSSGQKESLNNNLHKIFYTNLKLEEILRETQILMKNIQRTDVYFTQKYINPNGKPHQTTSQMMQIQQNQRQTNDARRVNINTTKKPVTQVIIQNKMNSGSTVRKYNCQQEIQI